MVIGNAQPIASADSVNYAGIRPQNNFQVLRYLIDRLYGTYDAAAGSASSNLWVDGGNVPGQAAQIRVSYDWTNGKESFMYPVTLQMELGTELNSSTYLHAIQLKMITKSITYNSTKDSNPSLDVSHDTHDTHH